MKRAAAASDGNWNPKRGSPRLHAHEGTVKASCAQSYRVLHPKALSGQQRVALSKPREIAHFSTYAGGQVRFDRSNLARYREPKIGADLLEGIELHTPKVESDPSVPPAPLAPLLATLTDAQTRHPKTPHFVTYRNNLNKILGTPYNTSNAWTFCAEKKNGIIYLDVRRTSDELSRNAQPHVNQVRACYAGRRFEAYATENAATPAATSDRKAQQSNTSDSDTIARSSNGPVNADDEYCGLFALTLGRMQLVVAAEIDCFDGADTDTETPSYLELKTTRVLRTDKDRFVFERYKLLSFWIQSYIVGTPRIVCGFRDDDFILRKLQSFRTTDIPSYCRKYWEPHACLAFANGLLSWISDTVKPGYVYQVTYHPHQHLVEIIPREAHEEESFLPALLSCVQTAA